MLHQSFLKILIKPALKTPSASNLRERASDVKRFDFKRKHLGKRTLDGDNASTVEKLLSSIYFDLVDCHSVRCLHVVSPRDFYWELYI